MNSIKIRMTAMSPVIHGAGTSGNEQVLRMESILFERNGVMVQASVPFLSGNSLKHQIRAAAARYALRAMGVDGGLSKAVVDLLFSGGHLNGKGTAIGMDQSRKLEHLFPVIGLCGASYGNSMTESKISVGHANLVCDENRWRLPLDLLDHPAASLSASDYIVRDFGTRHDQTGSVEGRKVLALEDQAATSARKTKLLDKAAKGEVKDKGDKGDSAQMIYSFQAVAAGSVWWSDVRVKDLSALELFALRSAFYEMSHGLVDDRHEMSFGAKSSIGYGKFRVALATDLRIPAPEMAAGDSALATLNGTDQGVYNAHLKDRRDEILAALNAAVGV